jgi:hypothetical protein
MNRFSPTARRVLAAYTVGIGPAALLAVLYFGGQVVASCLGLHCPPPSDGPIPIIGTATGSRVTVGVLTVAWVFALLAVSWNAIRERRGRILSLLAPAGICGVALGIVAASIQLVSGGRLRAIASTGIAITVLVAVAVWIVTVSLAAWHSDP